MASHFMEVPPSDIGPETDGVFPMSPHHGTSFNLTDEAKKQRRRESHNKVERRRRTTINSKTTEIGNTLPPRQLLGLRQNDVGMMSTSAPADTSSQFGHHHRRRRSGVGNRKSVDLSLPTAYDEWLFSNENPNKGDILTTAAAWLKQLTFACSLAYDRLDMIGQGLEARNKDDHFAKVARAPLGPPEMRGDVQGAIDRWGTLAPRDETHPLLSKMSPEATRARSKRFADEDAAAAAAAAAAADFGGNFSLPMQTQYTSPAPLQSAFTGGPQSPFARTATLSTSSRSSRRRTNGSSGSVRGSAGLRNSGSWDDSYNGQSHPNFSQYIPGSPQTNTQNMSFPSAGQGSPIVPEFVPSFYGSSGSPMYSNGWDVNMGMDSLEAPDLSGSISGSPASTFPASFPDQWMSQIGGGDDAATWPYAPSLNPTVINKDLDTMSINSSRSFSKIPQTMDWQNVSGLSMSQFQ